jgi:hypothetical protein
MWPDEKAPAAMSDRGKLSRLKAANPMRLTSAAGALYHIRWRAAAPGRASAAFLGAARQRSTLPHHWQQLCPGVGD